MKILSLEFSSNVRSVALADGARIVATASQHEGKHTRALALIDQAMAQAAWRPESVESIAVGLGPGSYTGIRMAIALAQGWHLARGTPLQGHCSVDVLVEQARAQGLTGSVSIAIDAQRAEFYIATYSIDARSSELTEPLHICPRSEIQARLDRGACVVGPDLSPWFENARPLNPQADALAALAARAPLPGPGAELEPVYLRPVAFVKAAPARPLPA
jgi:tRNA threonylcarbamoyladenosine biosynthesis protein TsaB